MYKVINKFKEKQHGGRVYEKGDTYPAEGEKLVKTRADFLAKVHPEYGVAFLEEIEEKKPNVKGSPKKAAVEKSDK